MVVDFDIDDAFVGCDDCYSQHWMVQLLLMMERNAVVMKSLSLCVAFVVVCVWRILTKEMLIHTNEHTIGGWMQIPALCLLANRYSFTDTFLFS